LFIGEPEFLGEVFPGSTSSSSFLYWFLILFSLLPILVISPFAHKNLNALDATSINESSSIHGLGTVLVIVADNIGVSADSELVHAVLDTLWWVSNSPLLSQKLGFWKSLKLVLSLGVCTSGAIDSDEFLITSLSLEIIDTDENVLLFVTAPRTTHS